MARVFGDSRDDGENEAPFTREAQLRENALDAFQLQKRRDMLLDMARIRREFIPVLPKKLVIGGAGVALAAMLFELVFMGGGLGIVTLAATLFGIVICVFALCMVYYSSGTRRVWLVSGSAAAITVVILARIGLESAFGLGWRIEWVLPAARVSASALVVTSLAVYAACRTRLVFGGSLAARMVSLVGGLLGVVAAGGYFVTHIINIEESLSQGFFIFWPAAAIGVIAFFVMHLFSVISFFVPGFADAQRQAERACKAGLLGALMTIMFLFSAFAFELAGMLALAGGGTLWFFKRAVYEKWYSAVSVELARLEREFEEFEPGNNGAFETDNNFYGPEA